MEGEAKNLYNMMQQQLLNIDENGNIVGFKSYVPYSANPADYVAGFSPLQEQTFKGAANLSVPGQFGQATDLAGAAGMGGINSAQQAYNYGAQGSQYGNLGAQYGAQGAGYGDIAAQIGQMGLQAQATGEGITKQSQDLAAQQAAAGDIYQQLATNPEAVQAYMSPYQQAVTQQAVDAAYRNADIQRTGRQATAAKAGAYGGSRQAIENAEAERALNTQLQSIEAQGLQSAYDKAMQSMQYGTSLGVQGLGGAQSGLGTALQGGQLGLSGIGTALQGLQGGMQGAGVGISGAQAGMQGAQTGLQGVSGAQAGYGLANQAGSNLANIGTQQNAAAQSILDQQNRFGAQQQQQQQNITNQAIQNYAMAQENPNMIAQNLSNLIRGTQGQGMTTQNYQAAPSALGTAASLGTAAMGAKAAGIFAEGGIVKLAQGGAIKGYADGGVTGIDNIERIAGKLSIPQLQQAMQNKTVPEYVGIPLLQMKTEEAQRAQAAQAAMQQGQQGGQAPTIKDQIMQQAQQAEGMQGIEGLPSNLPTEEMADGGIVAFGQGGDVPRFGVGGVPDYPLKPTDLVQYDLKPYEDIYKQTLNKDTEKPYTEEEFFRKQETERTGRGIKDIYGEEIKSAEARVKGLPAEEKEAMGYAIMAGAFEAMAEGEPNAARALGNLGAKVSKGAAAVKKDFKAQAKDLRREKQALDIANDQAKRADLAGDKAGFDRAQDRVNSASTAIAGIKTKMVDQQNEVIAAGRKAEYELMGKEVIQSMENAGKLSAANKTGGIELAKLRNQVFTNTISKFEKEYGTNAIQTKFGGDKAKADARFKEMFESDMAQALNIEPQAPQAGPQGNAQPTGTPMTATNPKTGERVVSYDNGKTWTPTK
jgi:hypothetical protein